MCCDNNKGVSYSSQLLTSLPLHIHKKPCTLGIEARSDSHNILRLISAFDWQSFLPPLLLLIGKLRSDQF